MDSLWDGKSDMSYDGACILLLCMIDVCVCVRVCVCVCVCVWTVSFRF